MNKTRGWQGSYSIEPQGMLRPGLAVVGGQWGDGIQVRIVNPFVLSRWNEPVHQIQGPVGDKGPLESDESDADAANAVDADG